MAGVRRRSHAATPTTTTSTATVTPAATAAFDPAAAGLAGDCDGEGGGNSEGPDLALPLADSVGDGDALGDCEGLDPGESVAVGVAAPDGEQLGVGLDEGDTELAGVGGDEGVSDGDGSGEGDSGGEGVALGEGDCVAVGELPVEAVGVGDGVSEGVELGVAAVEGLSDADSGGARPPGATTRMLPVGAKVAVLDTHPPVVGTPRNCEVTKPEHPQGDPEEKKLTTSRCCASGMVTDVFRKLPIQLNVAHGKTSIADQKYDPTAALQYKFVAPEASPKKCAASHTLPAGVGSHGTATAFAITRPFTPALSSSTHSPSGATTSKTGTPAHVGGASGSGAESLYTRTVTDAPAAQAADATPRFPSEVHVSVYTPAPENSGPAQSLALPHSSSVAAVPGRRGGGRGDGVGVLVKLVAGSAAAEPPEPGVQTPVRGSPTNSYCGEPAHESLPRNAATSRLAPPLVTLASVAEDEK